MASSEHTLPSIRQTGLFGAVITGLLALAAYTRTLAPDLLYSDSAEFQTLAYTLGTTHSTGYPIYLLLARLVGLVPIGSPAWRVNLCSALGAAVAIGATYLAIFRQTEDRFAGALGAAALAVSYTFWTQAVIAEVYIPAVACFVVCLVLLWRWQAAIRTEVTPVRSGTLFAATLLIGIGIGIHASVGLLVPVAAVSVVTTLARKGGAQGATLDRTARWHTIGIAAAGGLLGIALFVVTFLLIDQRDHPSSFINVMLLPSRSIWGLSAHNLARPAVRLWATVTGLQWRDAMLSGGIPAAIDALQQYATRLISMEFSPLTLLLACVGVGHAIHRRQWLLPLAFATTTVAAANYHPGDWYVFFLPSYALVAVAAGVGIAPARAWWRQRLRRRWPRVGPVISAVLTVAVLAGSLWGFLPSRIRALRAGITDFSQETYVFPVEDPWEPRRVAMAIVASVPDSVILVLDWRALYTVAYLAYVEGMRPGIALYEATPHGSDGQVAASLLETIDEALVAGRSVYVDTIHSEYRDRYAISRGNNGGLHELTLRRGQ